MKRFYFGSGTVRTTPPSAAAGAANASFLDGGSGVVFLDGDGEALEAYAVRQLGPTAWPEKMRLEEIKSPKTPVSGDDLREAKIWFEAQRKRSRQNPA